MRSGGLGLLVGAVMTARRSSGGPPRPGPVPFTPVTVGIVDVAQPIPAVPPQTDPIGRPYTAAYSYVRWGDSAIGRAPVALSPSGATPAEHASAIWHALQHDLRRRGTAMGRALPGSLSEDGLGPSGPETRVGVQPHVTVVVATRDRPELLDRCLRALLALDYPSFDVVVVDNAPSSDATARLIAARYADEPQVRRILEERPGLGIAHNAGVAVATGSIVAITDDDVVVDRRWLHCIVSGFTDPTVGCVTGMIVPSRLDTKAQWWLECYAGFSKGFDAKVYDLNGNRPADRLFPYAAGKLGSGANMAFRTDVLLQMGGFDAALGTGSGAFGGDDLAAFFEVVRSGRRLVYEPAAMVLHDHQSTEAALRRQLFGYGAGLTAYLTRTMIEHPSELASLAAKVPRAVRYALAQGSERNRRQAADFPASLRLREVAGMAVGPFAYIRTRWRRRHVAGPTERVATER